MQNRSIFPYRRHGPKKRVKHGGPNNRKPRGPQKGLPNSARDLLPMLQPATKALAQVLAGRSGASGQLGHARTMLAQAERMIAERAHNRLTPAEREEFFEQLARLKLTLADADAEAEVQAVEQHEPKPQVAPVAQERLKEMALALSVREAVRERPSQPDAYAAPAAGEASAHARAAPETAAQDEPQPAVDSEARDPEAGAGATGPGSAARSQGRLVLPKGGADQAVQALAIGSMARRRSRASNQAAIAAFAAATDEATRSARAPEAAGPTPSPAPTVEPGSSQTPNGPGDAQQGATPHHGNGAALEAQNEPEGDPQSEGKTRATRRARKAKHQGLPEGWVIDEEGFVVPGAS